MAAGAAAPLAGGEPTGVAVADAAYCVGLVFAVAALGACARAWQILAGALLLLPAALADPVPAALAGAALGLAAAALGGASAWRPLHAAAGGLLALGALSLPAGDPVASTAGLSAVALGLVAMGGLARLPVRRRRAVVRAAGAGGTLAAAAVLLALLGVAEARPDLERAVRLARAGLRAASQGDGQVAGQRLSASAELFEGAADELGSWRAQLALAVPVAGRQTRALHALASSGAELSRVGERLASALAADRLQVVGGVLPIEALSDLGPLSRSSYATLVRAQARLSQVDSPWLVAPVARRRDDLDGRVREARASAETLIAAVDVLPGMLGTDRPRRYFLALQTPSELRGAGGFIGSLGEIVADRGRLRLGDLLRTSDLNQRSAVTQSLDTFAEFTARYEQFRLESTWQNINMSPDFPTVASAIAHLYPQSGGRAIDGVIAIDPYGLAALLRVLGSVEVEGWPVPIDASNAVPVLLFEQYVRLQGDDRRDFVEAVARRVWDRLVTSPVDPYALVRALAPTAEGRHVMVASVHAEEQHVLERAGITGRMAEVRGDFLGVITQNAGGSKIDWFLTRTIEYTVRPDPSTGTARATARVTLRNDAPPGGLPPYIIGSVPLVGLPLGTSRLYVSIYTPLLLDGARLQGEPTLLQSEVELGRHVYSRFVTIPARSAVTLELELSGPLEIGERYRLDLHRQPTVHADPTTVHVIPPQGMELPGGRREHVARLRLTSDETLVVPLAG